MKDQYYLTIDQGSHASRALIFNQYGHMIFETHEDIPYFNDSETFIEYIPETLFNSVHTVIKRCLAHLGSDTQYIHSAGMATQRSTIGFLNKDSFKPLYRLISWQDRRNSAFIESISAQGSKIHERTGLFLTPHYGASKLKWCIDNIDEIKDAYDQGTLLAGPLSSILCALITKERAFLADPANASRTQLWNIDTHSWDPDLLTLFQIKKEPLPACVPTRYNFGHLVYTDHQNIPLNIITGDQSAALFSAGPLDHSSLYVNLGTGAFISAPLGSTKVLQNKLLTSVVYKEQDHSEYVLEGTVNGAGSALQWADTSLGIKIANIKDLDELAQSVSLPPLFMNGVSGLGSPYWQPDFENEFIGSTADSNAQLVAILESILFLIMSNIDLMREHTAELKQIRVTGGLSESDYLCQSLANLSGLKVIRPDEKEATAKGTAYLLLDDRSYWEKESVNKKFECRVDAPLQKRYTQWKEHMNKRLKA